MTDNDVVTEADHKVLEMEGKARHIWQSHDHKVMIQIYVYVLGP